MRAAVIPAASPFRVDAHSPSLQCCGTSGPAGQRPYQVQFVNASVCLATGGSGSIQEASAAVCRLHVQFRAGPAGCTSLRRTGKGIDVGRLCTQRSLCDSVACRCLGSGDSSNGPQERAGLRDAQNDGGEAGAKNGNDANKEEEPATSSVWDMPARHKRMQAVAAKMGDPLRDMVTNASKKLQEYLDNYKRTKVKGKADKLLKPENEAPQESEWERWQKVFAEVEERENLATVLKFQLEEAVSNENFQEAARLKAALDAVVATDTVAEVMNELQRALEEERYDDAALFRDKAGAGLVGWWVGLTEGGNDPYGRIINIYPAQGRLVAKSYSARQLASSAAGVPIFEVFIAKDGARDYQLQAVYLQRDANVATEALPGSIKAIDLSVMDIENLAEEGGKELKSTDELSVEVSEDNKGKAGDADLLDEGLSKILNFLKDRMPDVKLKVFKVVAPDGVEADLPKIVGELMEEAEEDKTKLNELAEASTSSSNGEKTIDNKFPLDGKIPVGRGSATTSENEDKGTPIRLVVGGVNQNNVDSMPPRLPVRIPARLEPKSRNSFVFHIEDDGSAPAAASVKELVPSWKVATIATQASADLMPDDVAKVLWNVEKVPVKVSKEMGEIIRLAVSQAQRRRGLFKSTSFRRINVSDSSTDPLCGLYIGAFGPYTSEVVQLQRKYGHWEDEEAISSGKKLEFFEYVEAVKLTGDLNVPAGQVTFRARIGKECRLSHRGMYPEELGVVSRYKGQGRLAEPGFRNPVWIDGELVILDGKGAGHTNGSELGFVYSVPERHFLVLFSRLKLKE